MKKIVLSLAVIGLALTSCSDGTQVEASDAANVNLIENAKTITYDNVDESSKLDWGASHFGGAAPRFGIISLKSAEFLVNDNLLTNANVEIDMSTLRVDNFGEDTASQNQLTGHLVSADFFDVPNHPTSSFELTGIESIEGDFNSTLTGNLTIMNISKSISFKANVDVSDNEVSMKSEKFILDRTDWELIYNIEGSEGVPIDYIISNDLEFTIDVTVSK